MTLTKADKKEIAKMIADIISTQNSTQTSLKDNLPDFKNWSDEAIVLDCGIIVAPENYYEGDKRYFTWDEAMEAEKTMREYGWRLPTAKEWALITAECGYKDDGGWDGDLFNQRLNLEYTGWVDCDNMNGYNDNPVGLVEDGRLYYQGNHAYLWSSTIVSSTNAYSLGTWSTVVRPAESSNKALGYALRCVKIRENDFPEKGEE